MIGVILSAGMGKRLRPLTDNIPKPLLEINGMTLFERMIRNCMNAGIRKFIAVVGYNGDKVADFSKTLEEKYDIEIKIIENERYDVTNTSVSTYLASEFIAKNNPEDFILINGDNVVDPKLIMRIASRSNTSIIVDNDKELNDESFKLILSEETFSDNGNIASGKIEEIGKEIDIASSMGEFIGISKVSKDNLKCFNEILVGLIGEDEQNYYDFAYKDLSSISTIDFVLTDGLKWTEIDDKNDWEFAQKLIWEFEG